MSNESRRFELEQRIQYVLVYDTFPLCLSLSFRVPSSSAAAAEILGILILRI